jgi:large subunit ribosomal protein L13
VDASGQTLGRLATRIAHVLRGKDRPTFTPNVDDGAGVIVVNAGSVRVTGRKLEQKFYARHSGYPGGIRMTRLDEMLAQRPDRVIRLAVRGMLPKNTLGRNALKRLRVYDGPEHPHEAQRPQTLEVGA